MNTYTKGLPGAWFAVGLSGVASTLLIALFKVLT